ncbi:MULTISPECIES: uroporphyrinogen decarboxylase [unclassified Gilliamella]|uniref:uroporphyrinogen decarboxylase n=1 Tax=unclassified Gilliamella TaxID=2685620 RepID=UPI00080EE814|nr:MULTISPECIES: uroporphyrinogen decarboxylase [Gilliamella]MCX8586483.1 uroporphyrinogen decarboxylase [Gilliamella sp. B3562]MCX8660377.1 uroporphyrinogen decarboxylase [Gilliamella sp. B2772]MCX8661943.1 uroporphyrinogen decarboxylase [Gilliamella sp. B2911]MCX8671705.1 uroporphyrinogen decarboxylase [Gilliamella sp. B2785]MCX8673709.1 uroporphyrinogen decarboxylase [Gilliamella sp. B3023]
MSQLKNDRYLRALQCLPVDYTPIWMMRQAGRYLPEYRQLRAKAGDFMTMCQTPELACEATLQPIRRFDLDAAIIFSDILTIPDAMGLGLYFETGEGPKFKKTISCLDDIAQLPIPDPGQSLKYVMDAIGLTKKELGGKVPLIGFSGSPWTLATYMVEGGSSKTFTKIKKMLYCEPKALHLLLEKLANSVILYLNAQIEAGAQSIMIFDTWGGVLSHESYRAFSLHYMELILSQLKRGKKSQNITSYVPVTLFTKGGGLWLDTISKSGADAIGVDWTVDLNQIEQKGKIAIQGNLDPSILYANKETIESNVESVLSEFGYHNGHVFNLGHGIHQDIPIEHVQYLVESVHTRSKRFHS